jgi:hypothetical protein
MLANTILAPFGDHAGTLSLPRLVGVLVRLTGLLPSALTTQMSLSTFRAILVPSGDQAGSRLFTPRSISRCGLLPSGFIAKIWVPFPLFSNAIRPFCPGNAAPAGAAGTASIAADIAATSANGTKVLALLGRISVFIASTFLSLLTGPCRTTREVPRAGSDPGAPRNIVQVSDLSRRAHRP